MRRNSDFRCLTCNVGKGQKNGLRRLEIEERDRVVTVCNKEEIEKKIINHNKEHFSEVKGTTAHDDKIHYRMKEEEMRDTILNGQLNRNKCDDEHVHQFLLLLKSQNELKPDNKDKTQKNCVKTSSSYGKKNEENRLCFQGEIVLCVNAQ